AQEKDSTDDQGCRPRLRNRIRKTSAVARACRLFAPSNPRTTFPIQFSITTASLNYHQMEFWSLKSKRINKKVTTSEDHLHPGERRGGKWTRLLSRSKSPRASGSSTTTNDGLTYDNQSHQISSEPSPRSGTPQGGDIPTTAELTPAIALENDSNDTTSNTNSTSAAWAGLEQALLVLRIATKTCPTLRLAIDDLVSCLPLFEMAARNHKDYEDLATSLKLMAGLLTQHLENATSEPMINIFTGIAEAVRREIELVGKRQSREGLRRVLGSSGDDADLIRRYRRIEQLFRQLQGEASLSAWSISSKHYVNTQLENLRAAKLARYNSELAMDVSRRACTENTRTEILDNLVKWSGDRNMASIYWMNGMAGTGKTTIAYSTCVALESSKQLAASFFCTRMSPECRDAKRIVSTIAYQLARRSAPFRSALCKVLEEDMDVATGTISAQFEQLLRVPLMEAKNNMPNNLVVVIDGLDECDDSYIAELFLGLLFRSIVDLPIRFFVTSRPEPMIRHRMMSESERSRSILYLHEIEPSLVQADIELYLKKELAHVFPLDEEVKKLAEHAGKLFIYAATAVRYICPLNRAVSSRERLETILAANTTSNKSLLPIDALYSAILTAAIEDEALERKEQGYMKLVVWTIVCAREPVLISTIAAITGLGNLDKVVAALEPLRSVFCEGILVAICAVVDGST
ncbi:unnamed protein product, partial [Rhizoctonia solani]